VKPSVDRKEWDLCAYSYLQSADTLKYIFKDIFICIMNEQSSNEGESI